MKPLTLVYRSMIFRNASLTAFLKSNFSVSKDFVFEMVIFILDDEIASCFWFSFGTCIFFIVLFVFYFLISGGRSNNFIYFLCSSFFD